MKGRSKNERDILSTIFRLPVPTRRVIADYLGLSHVTVGKVLQSLEDSGDINRTGMIVSEGSGRPSEVFGLQGGVLHGIGLHLEPGVCRVALVDTSKEVIGTWILPFSDHMLEKGEMEAALLTLSREAISRVSAFLGDKQRELVIGVSLPGFINTVKNMWIAGLQLGHFSDIDIETLFSDETVCPVFIEDTSRSLAHLQLMKGGGDGDSSHFIIINMGLGLGAGIVVNGDVFFGTDGIAGEIGHIPLGNSMDRCSCGNIGCSETRLSAEGIRKTFQEQLSHGVRSSLNRGKSSDFLPTIEDILKAAEEADFFTLRALKETALSLSELVHIVVKAFTPGRLILSGRGALLSNFLIPELKESLTTKLLPEIYHRLSIGVQAYSEYNEAEGVALYAMGRYLSQE